MTRSSIGAVVASLFLLGGCGTDGGGGSGSSEETFSNGGMTLTATIAGSSTQKTVTVTDAADTTVLTLVVSRTGVTLSAPGETDISMTFYSALEELPTDYTASRMAIYVAGIRALDSTTTARPDSPGCDWFPDTQCTLDCCAQHDSCYSDNNCGASSWLWGFGTEACDHCNDIAYDCIAAACIGMTESFLPNNCFDAACNMHYDCPPDYDSCTCEDICADSGVSVPSSCGDGSCTAGEDTTNCWNDCAFGIPAQLPCSSPDSECASDEQCGGDAVCVDCLCVDLGIPEACPPLFRTRATGDWLPEHQDANDGEIGVLCRYSAPPELDLPWGLVVFQGQYVSPDNFDTLDFDCEAFYGMNGHITALPDTLTSETNYVWLRSHWATTGVGQAEGDQVGMPDEARLAWEEALFRGLEDIARECSVPCTNPVWCN